MKLLPSLFKNTTTSAAPEPKLSSCSSTSSYSSWPWPSCTQTRTLSFRNIPGNYIFKTINSAYFDSNTPESFFTNSSEGCASFSTTVASEEDNSSGGSGDPIETMINKGLRSERLFFELGETSSILDKDSTHSSKALEDEEDDVDDEVEVEVEDNEDIPFKQSVALSMDSPDPHADFRKSMEEMVEAHGLKDWEQLEELLSWYLRVNGKSNHGYIIGAFVDLLTGLAFSSTNSCSEYYSPSTPLSLYNSTSSRSSSSTSTPCVSSIGPEEGSEMSTSTIPCLSSLLEAEEEIKDEDDDDDDNDDDDDEASC